MILVKEIRPARLREDALRLELLNAMRSAGRKIPACRRYGLTQHALSGQVDELELVGFGIEGRDRRPPRGSGVMQRTGADHPDCSHALVAPAVGVTVADVGELLSVDQVG